MQAELQVRVESGGAPGPDEHERAEEVRLTLVMAQRTADAAIARRGSKAEEMLASAAATRPPACWPMLARHHPGASRESRAARRAEVTALGVRSHHPAGRHRCSRSAHGAPARTGATRRSISFARSSRTPTALRADRARPPWSEVTIPDVRTAGGPEGRGRGRRAPSPTPRATRTTTSEAPDAGVNARQPAGATAARGADEASVTGGTAGRPGPKLESDKTTERPGTAEHRRRGHRHRPVTRSGQSGRAGDGAVVGRHRGRGGRVPHRVAQGDDRRGTARSAATRPVTTGGDGQDLRLRSRIAAGRSRGSASAEARTDRRRRPQAGSMVTTAASPSIASR